MLKKYRVVVTTATVQRYEITAHSDEEVHDLWDCDPTMFLIIGEPVTTETLEIGQSVPIEDGAR